jgi:hypothetical protein
MSGASAVAAIGRGRRAAEALMLDTCTVQRLASETTDPDTGVVVKHFTAIYVGKCKIQHTQRPTNAHPTNIGESEVLQARIELHLPTSVVGVLSDDFVTVTASALDADLVGATFHVRELAHKTLQTARRYGLLEVTS